MESKAVSIAAPVAVGGVKLYPIVRTSVNCWSNGGRISGSGFKQSVAVLVVSPGATLGLAVTGEEIPLEELIQEVPGIGAIIGQR